jgi:hypothetical protein
MRTKSSLLENTRNYRLTKKGIVRNIFCHIKERCAKYNRELGFTSDQLLAWCINQEVFHKIYWDYLDAGFDKNLKPSIDRLDVFRGYTFDNIQITTYKDNRDKGDKEKLILWGRPIIKLDMNGVEIERYSSIKQAVDKTGLRQSLISAVISGKRNHTGNYKFIYHPELLKP